MSLRSGLSSLYHEHRQAMRDAKQRQLANKERNERRQEAASAQVGPAIAWLWPPRSHGMHILAAITVAGDEQPGRPSTSCSEGLTLAVKAALVQAITHTQDLLLKRSTKSSVRCCGLVASC